MWSFLDRKWLTKVRNRTYTQTIQEKGKIPIVASGAWQIEIYNTGNNPLALYLPDGTIILEAPGFVAGSDAVIKASPDTYYIFPGNPQVMRDDDFRIEFLDNGGQTFLRAIVVYHRLVKEGGDKQIGDQLYIDIKED